MEISSKIKINVVDLRRCLKHFTGLYEDILYEFLWQALKHYLSASFLKA
jgi:hypothetical protein